jgi:hypothetical protein
MKRFTLKIIHSEIERDWEKDFANRDVISRVRLTALLNAALACGNHVSIHTCLN